MKKKPKLILLNGPLAIGKSTIAKMYGERNPLALSLDIDAVRASLGQWREHRAESAGLAKRMAAAMARVALDAGHDVIVAQILRWPEDVELFEKLAREAGADLCEVLLHVSKEEAVRRFVERGRAEGHELGYEPDGLIGRSGGIPYVEQMYDEMMAIASSRPRNIIINSVQGAPDDTYASLLNAIGETST